MRQDFIGNLRLKCWLFILLGKVRERDFVGGIVLEKTAAAVVNVFDHRAKGADLVLIRADFVLDVEELFAHDQNEGF